MTIIELEIVNQGTVQNYSGDKNKIKQFKLDLNSFAAVFRKDLR